MNVPINSMKNSSGPGQSPNVSTVTIDQLLEQIRRPGSDLEALTGQMIQLSFQQCLGHVQLQEKIRRANLPRSKAEQIRIIFNSEPALNPRLNRLTAGVLNEAAQLSSKGNDPGAYRNLVQEGRRHRFDLERFGRCLRQEGLSSPRASEIVVIARSETISQRFVNGSCSVRQALEEARAHCGRKQGGANKKENKKDSEPDDGRCDKQLARWQEQVGAAIDKLLRLVAKTETPGDVPKFLCDTGLCTVWIRSPNSPLSIS